MRPLNIQKLLVPISDGEVNSHGQNPLNYLKLVKGKPQTCKGEREVSNLSNSHEINKIVLDKIVQWQSKI